MDIKTNGNIKEPMDFMRALLKWRKEDPKRRSISLSVQHVWGSERTGELVSFSTGYMHLYAEDGAYVSCESVDSPEDIAEISNKLYKILEDSRNESRSKI